MEIAKIIAMLETAFPPEDACSWDYVGWQVKINSAIVVKKILVALDVSEAVILKAIAQKVELIICHHPLIFANNLDDISLYAKNIYQKLKDNNINLYVIHTNFDKNKNGMNYQIAEALNLKTINDFGKEKTAIVSYNNHLTMLQIITKIKKYFNFQQIVLFENKKVSLIRNIVLVSGSGGSLISEINDNNTIDLFITGEIKWNYCVEATDKKINVLALGHQMEEKFIDMMQNKLATMQLSTNKITVISYYYNLPKFI